MISECKKQLAVALPTRGFFLIIKFSVNQNRENMKKKNLHLFPNYILQYLNES
jgi:hypothetical protein